MKGPIKQKWGNLTDDDLDYIEGSRDKFAGKLQERYGLGKEQAQKRADEWLKAQDERFKAQKDTETHVQR